MMGFSPVPEGFQRASGKPFGAPAGAYPCPRVGPDAPTTARIGTCRPMGRSHFSFDGERKVCKRKPAARRLREKALYCPFLKEGVRNVARRIVGELTHTFVRARAHSYPLSKRARLFPSAAYHRPRPRGRRRAYTSLAGWNVTMWLGYFCNAKEEYTAVWDGRLLALRKVTCMHRHAPNLS